MNAMRKDSTEAVVMITSAAVHVVSRVLAASEERIRKVLLDPAIRNIWAMTAALTTRVPPVILEQGDVLLEECIQGHVTDVRIRILRRAHVCEIHVELRIDLTFDLTTFYGMGIDDLWETRLYAIADLLIPTHHPKNQE